MIGWNKRNNRVSTIVDTSEELVGHRAASREQSNAPRVALRELGGPGPRLDMTTSARWAPGRSTQHGTFIAGHAVNRPGLRFQA